MHGETLKFVLVSLCRNILYVVQGEQTSLDPRGLWRKAFLFSDIKKNILFTLHRATSYNENDVNVGGAWKTLAGGLFGYRVCKRCQSPNGVAADGQPYILSSGMLRDAGLKLVTVVS